MATVEEFLDNIDMNLTGALLEGYQNLSAAMDTPLRLFLILLVAVYGGLMLFGTVEMPLRRAVRHVLIAIGIYILVTSADEAAEFLQRLFIDGPAQVAAAVVNGPGGNDTDSINGTIGEAFDKGMDAAFKVMEQGGFTDLAPVLLGIGIVLIVIFMIGYALFLIVLAKIALTTLILLTPLFVPLFLAGPTRGIAEGWLRQVINFALVPILVYTILALVINLSVEAAERVQTAGSIELSDVAPYYLIGGVTFLLLLQVLGIAGGIAGGISLSSMGAIGRGISGGRSMAGAPGRMREQSRRRKTGQREGKMTDSRFKEQKSQEKADRIVARSS